jgi:hypothetical protein
MRNFSVSFFYPLSIFRVFTEKKYEKKLKTLVDCENLQGFYNQTILFNNHQKAF